MAATRETSRSSTIIRRIIAGFTLATAVTASAASGQVISLTGDLVGGAVGTPSSLFNTTFTQPFSVTAANGTIAGDVIVANNAAGTQFDLTITNLTYNCTIVNTANAGDVIVIVNHFYLMGAVGPFTGSHSLSGSWTSGPFSAVQLDSLQDVGNSNTPLATLLATATPFALGPASVAVPGSATGALYQIQAILRLHTDGLGSITLPSSAHISTTLLVPEPTTLFLAAASIPIALRRRR